MTVSEDQRWLRMACELASQCPPSDTAFSVGAIIVGADGEELSRGYSRESHPTIHAEEAALEKARDNPGLPGATIYSSMEPCGERQSRPRTCARLIIESGVHRVVFRDREPADFVHKPGGHQLIIDAGLRIDEVPLTGP